MIEQTGQATAIQLKAMEISVPAHDNDFISPSMSNGDLDSDFCFVTVERTSGVCAFEVREERRDGHSSFLVTFARKPISATKTHLLPGDEILALNGRSVRELTDSSIRDVIENDDGDQIELIVRRRPNTDRDETPSSDGDTGQQKEAKMEDHVNWDKNNNKNNISIQHDNAYDNRGFEETAEDRAKEAQSPCSSTKTAPPAASPCKTRSIGINTDMESQYWTLSF